MREKKFLEAPREVRRSGHNRLTSVTSPTLTNPYEHKGFYLIGFSPLQMWMSAASRSSVAGSWETCV